MLSIHITRSVVMESLNTRFVIKRTYLTGSAKPIVGVIGVRLLILTVRFQALVQPFYIYSSTS
jgi:hypothetical protein